MSEWAFLSNSYCLNLDRNIQRWDDSSREFQSVGLAVERINCIESMENRYISFNHSHYDTVKKGYDAGGNFAIFEDDVVFDNWRHVNSAATELPADFEAMYLGANFHHGERRWPFYFSRYLAVLPNAWMTHAIVYSPAGAKFVLDNFDPNTFPVYDEWLAVNLMPRGKTFVIRPMICYQRPGYSDIWQTDANYSTVHPDGNKYLARL